MLCSCNGNVMNTFQHTFNKALGKSAHNARIAYAEMNANEQRTVIVAFQRHINAMHRTGFKQPEATWLQEFILDFAAGRDMN